MTSVKRRLNRRIRRDGMVHCRECHKIVYPIRKYFEDGKYIWVCPDCRIEVNYTELEEEKGLKNAVNN